MQFIRTNLCVLVYNNSNDYQGGYIMDERLLRFFKKINFNDVSSFDEATLKECVVNKKESYWTL